MEQARKNYFSQYQARQMYEMLSDMLLRNPALLDQLPGVTEEQRKIAGQNAQRL